MEIFKTYQRRGGQKIYECVAEFKDYYVLVWKPTTVIRPESIMILKSEGNGYSWIEYIEPPKPIIHERWITWFKDYYTGSIYCCMDLDKPTQGKNPILFQQQIRYTEIPEPKCGCKVHNKSKCMCA